MTQIAGSSQAAIEIDQVSEAEWSGMCLRFQDATINQTWGFGEVLSGPRNLSHIVLKRNDSVEAAAQVRVITAPILKSGIAYVGYGPMWRRSGRAEGACSLKSILMAMRDEYAVRRRLLLRVLPNVFEDAADAELVRSSFAEAGFRRHESPHKTLFLQLDSSLEELRKGLHQKWRNKLNAAGRNSIEIEHGTRTELFDEFKDVYLDMRARKAYPADIDIDKYASLQKRVPDDLKPLIIMARLDGKPAAGGVFSTLGDTGIWMLGATSEAGLKSKAAYVVQWHAIRWLKENGYRRYDLGGVDPVAVPTTYQFKSRICGKEPHIYNRIGEFTACESRVSLLTVQLGALVRSWKRRNKGRKCAQ